MIQHKRLLIIAGLALVALIGVVCSILFLFNAVDKDSSENYVELKDGKPQKLDNYVAKVRYKYQDGEITYRAAVKQLEANVESSSEETKSYIYQLIIEICIDNKDTGCVERTVKKVELTNETKLFIATSLGDAYLAAGEKNKAITKYEQALVILKSTPEATPDQLQTLKTLIKSLKS